MSSAPAPGGSRCASMARAPPIRKRSAAIGLRRCILQDLAKRFGERGELRIARQRGELGRCRDESLASLGVTDDVVECNRARPNVTDGSRNANEVVVAGARMKTQAGLDDGERHVLPLELCVRSAQRANE